MVFIGHAVTSHCFLLSISTFPLLQWIMLIDLSENMILSALCLVQWELCSRWCHFLSHEAKIPALDFYLFIYSSTTITVFSRLFFFYKKLAYYRIIRVQGCWFEPGFHYLGHNSQQIQLTEHLPGLFKKYLKKSKESKYTFIGSNQLNQNILK